jgi:CRISPR-associated protein Cmr6
MTEKNKKPQKQWKSLEWSIGSERTRKKDKFNPPTGNVGKKGFKGEPGQQGQPGTDNSEAGDKRFQRANTGWLFYKEYYHDIPFSHGQDKDELKPFFEAKNRVITSRQLLKYREEIDILQGGFESMQCFEMTTVYPGLVTGLGTPHETRRKGEYKLGFHFDHTTGLPVITGSSVKGTLRSAFRKSTEYIKYLLDNTKGEKISLSAEYIGLLEKEIFDGLTPDEKGKDKPISLYSRDIFFDAPVTTTGNGDEHFLASDFITPHPDPLKAPVPLEFLKVLPQVTFLFRFRLFPSLRGLISPTLKISLFREILSDLGIGAKTNVGYGKFR